MAHSADGDWFWTGSEWVAARSPDGAWWWNGARWVPSGPAQPAPFRYQPTVWTRRLQLLIVALTVLSLVVFGLTFPSLMGQAFQQTIDRSLASQPGGAPPDIAQFRQTMNGIVTATTVAGAAFVIVFYGVLMIGVWRLWRWVFWYYLVVGFLAALAVPQDVTYALGIGPYHLPLWSIALSVLQALAWLALSIWMLVVYRRYGTWARRRVPIEDVATDFP